MTSINNVFERYEVDGLDDTCIEYTLCVSSGVTKFRG